MEHIISDPHGRRSLLGTAALLLTIVMSSTALPALAAPGPIAVGTDGFARFDVFPEAGAAQVWIEVEDPTIDAADVVVRLGAANQTVTDTALGSIVIVPASSGIQSFGVALTTSSNPDIAVTVIDASGTIISSATYRVTLTDYRTLPQQAAASGVPGWLANTGLSAGIYLALTVFGGLAVLVGVALNSRRTTKAAR